MLKLITAPNPILKQKSQALSKVDEQARQLFDQMLETMYQSSGIGLAAVQVGIAKAMLVVDLRDIVAEDGANEDCAQNIEHINSAVLNDDSNRITHQNIESKYQSSSIKQSHSGPLFLANPKILHFSEEMVLAQEGCLSVPEEFIDVPRAQNIVVQFLNYHNELQTIEASGWLARVIQHEMDHLAGVLMIDYVSKLKRDVILRRLGRKNKHYL